MTKKKIFKRIGWTLTILFILMNIIAGFHAYKFTHFADSSEIKTKSPEKLSSLDKFKTLFFGVNNPRPVNNLSPIDYYQTIELQSNKKIQCWYINKDNSVKTDTVKGVVILFHGYSG